MYGFPLTLYVLSGWLRSKYPGLDLLTLAMFPVLAWMYARLARREEQDMQARYGEAYVRSVAGKPRFIPWPVGR